MTGLNHYYGEKMQDEHFCQTLDLQMQWTTAPELISRKNELITLYKSEYAIFKPTQTTYLQNFSTSSILKRAEVTYILTTVQLWRLTQTETVVPHKNSRLILNLVKSMVPIHDEFRVRCLRLASRRFWPGYVLK